MLSEMERDGYFDATGYHKWADLKCNMEHGPCGVHVSIDDPSNAGAKLQSEWYLKERIIARPFTTADGTACLESSNTPNVDYRKCVTIGERICS